MITAKSTLFSHLWLIVPILDVQDSLVRNFLVRHQWVIQHGGHILFKAVAKPDTNCEELINQSGATLIQQPDEGLCGAWNQAMDYLCRAQLSDRDYVAFLGLDDEMSYKFCRAASGFRRGKDSPDFIYGDARIVFNGFYKDCVSSDEPALFCGRERAFDIFHPGMMNRWGAIRDHRFDTRYRLAGDFDFYIGLSQRHTVKYRYLPIIQATIGAEGVSNRPSAKGIYRKEWSRIATERKVIIRRARLRFNFLRLIGTVPGLTSLMRKAYWALSAQKIVPQ